MAEQDAVTSPYAQFFGAEADVFDRQRRQDKREFEAPVLERLKREVLDAIARSFAARLEADRKVKELALALDLATHGSVNVCDQRFRLPDDIARPQPVTTNNVAQFCSAVNAFLGLWGSPVTVKPSARWQESKLHIILNE